MAASSKFRQFGIIAVIFLAGVIAGVTDRSRAADGTSAPIIGVVHQTEIRIAPEISGRLVAFRETAGQEVHKGDVLAVLSSPELTAALEEAKANSAAARADRANVFAGVRKEEVDIAAENVRIAEANLVLARQQHARAVTLASSNFASKQQLDEAITALSKAEAGLSFAQATYAQRQAGPTKEERAIAEAKVAFADATAADLEAKLAKTMLVAPVDGVVRLLVAELGEAISPGQPVMTLEVGHERWFTFTVREDRLSGIAIGSPLTLLTAKGERIGTRVTELRPLGEFAVWRAARAVGDHDINSFLVRADPIGDTHSVEPGMTVWIDRNGGTHP
jgi:HlyD family secretion protein